MSLSPEEAETLKRLKARLDASAAGFVDSQGKRRLGFATLDAYYNGLQVLEQLGLAVPDDLRKFTTIVAWPGTQVDAIEERCDVEGFRFPGKPEADTGLAAVWQYNDLDDESQMGHIDSLVFGRSYVCVGSGEDPEFPLVTVESPLEMVHEWSPRDRETRTAARFYTDDSAGVAVARATLYTDTTTVWLLQNDQREWVEDPDLPRDNHNLGRCPVVPLINRSRSHDRYGVSEMGRIITLTDAAARALTNAQVATELMSLPQRYASGMSQADFTDPLTGEMVTKWNTYFGSVWATSNPEAKFGQFTGADLRNFESIISHYAQLVAGVTGLPMRYLGQQAANPPSADGIRADEARLVKTCERKSRSWGASWERVMRLVRLHQTGSDDPALASMETLWRDPATPTRAQSADAAVKLFAAGISSRRQSRRDVGYSSVQIANMERDDAANPDAITQLASELRTADRVDPDAAA
jgi:hypothetical protein